MAGVYLCRFLLILKEALPYHFPSTNIYCLILMLLLDIGVSWEFLDHLGRDWGLEKEIVEHMASKNVFTQFEIIAAILKKYCRSEKNKTYG